VAIPGIVVGAGSTSGRPPSGSSPWQLLAGERLARDRPPGSVRAARGNSVDKRAGSGPLAAKLVDKPLDGVGEPRLSFVVPEWASNI